MRNYYSGRLKNFHYGNNQIRGDLIDYEKLYKYRCSSEIINYSFSGVISTNSIKIKIQQKKAVFFQ